LTWYPPTTNYYGDIRTYTYVDTNQKPRIRLGILFLFASSVYVGVGIGYELSASSLWYVVVYPVDDLPL